MAKELKLCFENLSDMDFRKALFYITSFGARYLPATNTFQIARRFDCGSVDGFMQASHHEYQKRLVA